MTGNSGACWYWLERVENMRGPGIVVPLAALASLAVVVGVAAPSGLVSGGGPGAATVITLPVASAGAHSNENN